MKINNEKGLTIVELMVVLIISSIVTGAMYSLYSVQQTSTITQTQVAEMQQNLRTGIDMVAREIRMAGYDPTDAGLYGITAADATSMTFTWDVCEDGGQPVGAATSTCGTTEMFRVYVSDNELRRTNGGGAIAENVENVELHYVLEQDINDDGIWDTTTDPDDSTELDLIRAVEISLLVKSSRSSETYTHDEDVEYTTGSGATWTDFNDNNRRRFIRRHIVMRNMGL